MELLICIINKTELLDDVLAGFLEAGIPGCTVLDSQGMGKIISEDIPIFSGFSSMFSGARTSNVTIFSVIKEKKQLKEAIRVINEIYGSFDDPSTGILFTVPVNMVQGLSKPGS